MSDAFYVHGLRVEDFLRCELIALDLDGPGLTVVSGDNGAGKSSLLKAIHAALAGRQALPDKPVREGQERAEVVVDLGDRIVKLRVKADRSTSLTVEGKDGRPYRSPQKLLDDLLGELSFDPASFADQEAKDQTETLRRLVGLDTRALDEEHSRVYAERTGVNREVRMLEGQLAGIVVPPEPPEPEIIEVPAEIDIGEIARRQQAALAAQHANERERRDLMTLRQGVAAAAREVADLEAKLAVKRELLETARAEVERQERVVAELVEPDMSTLNVELERAQAQNRAAQSLREANAQARARAERATAERSRALTAQESKRIELETKKAVAADLTERLEAIYKEKAAALAAVKFPCEGLGIEGDVVTYRGVPLSQASTGEQLTIALEIAAALNPKLRLILVRQGNDADLPRLRAIAEWAREREFQVLLERVATDTPGAIVIEAGRVRRAGAPANDEFAGDSTPAPEAA